MKALVLLVALSACTDGVVEHFVVDYEDRALGPGLEYTFMPMWLACEPQQRYPYGCHQRHPTINQVSATGAGEIRNRTHDVFTMLGREEGTARVDLHATVDGEPLAGKFDVPVLPIAYSQLGWYTSDAITEQHGAAFRSSTAKVWQQHYRVPREKLVGALASEIAAAELDGDAVWTLAAGTTSAAFVTASEQPRHAAAISTGDVTGTATVGTSAGGTFVLDVVDESAIARLRADSPSQLTLVLQPFDASDRPILGCPDSGPTISDARGAVRVESIEPTAWLHLCEIELAWTGEPIDTTVVVTWGGREARVEISAKP